MKKMVFGILLVSINFLESAQAEREFFYFLLWNQNFKKKLLVKVFDGDTLLEAIQRSNSDLILNPEPNGQPKITVNLDNSLYVGSNNNFSRLVSLNERWNAPQKIFMIKGLQRPQDELSKKLEGVKDIMLFQSIDDDKGNHIKPFWFDEHNEVVKLNENDNLNHDESIMSRIIMMIRRLYYKYRS